MSRQFRYSAAAIAITVSLACGVSAALAAKKMTYEQAWTKCKAEIGANVPGSDTTTSAARHSAGGACMKKYGFRLKKGSM